MNDKTKQSVTDALPPFDHEMVQAVYIILCDDVLPPPEEHWEGFTARRIVKQYDDTIENLRAQLAEASQELKELHESRNALIDRDHELTLKWAEAQRDSERLDWMIEQRAYVVSDPDCCDGYWLNYQRHDGTLWAQVTEHETPRAAIDAAMGEQS